MRILIPLIFLCGFLNAQKNLISFSLQKGETNCIVKLNSIKKFPCKNYGIITTDYENADTIIIAIREFVAPTPCRGGSDIARDSISITPTGKRFYIKFRNGVKSDKWRVFQSDTMYHVREEGPVSFSEHVLIKDK